MNYLHPSHLSIRPRIIGTLAAALLAVPVMGHAATIQSGNFDLRYDYNNGQWNLVGGSTTNGDFALSPTAVVTASGSNYGVIYGSDGSLTAGSTESGSTDGQGRPPTQTGHTGNGSGLVDFALTLTGAYTGSPGDAAGSPNYSISLVITNISVYGLAWDLFPNRDFAWSETTAGHTGTSSTIVLPGFMANANNLRIPSNYTLLSWNPDDFETSGLSQSRSFALQQNRFLQGLHIEGYVVVNYEAIPEPGSAALVLLGCGAAALQIVRRRKQS